MPDQFQKKDRILVLGVGNYLMGDEGVGVHLAQAMEKMDLSATKLDILDGGTGGFFLMGYFDEYPTIIFVDATMDSQPAGTITLREPRFAADFPKALSVHDVGLKDMIEAVYLLGKVPKFYLFTISIAEITPMTIELSMEVENSVSEVIKSILALERKLINEKTV